MVWDLILKAVKFALCIGLTYNQKMDVSLGTTHNKTSSGSFEMVAQESAHSPVKRSGPRRLRSAAQLLLAVHASTSPRYAFEAVCVAVDAAVKNAKK